MKKLNRIVSLILCAAMLFGMFPLHTWAENDEENGTCTITLSGNIYKLVDAPTAGKNYLILDRDSAGSANALSKSGNDIANQTVTVKAADAVSSVVYVENVDSATVWTAYTGLKFISDGRYLHRRSGSSSNNPLRTDTYNSTDFSYNANDNVLSYKYGSSTYYVRLNSGWKVDTNSNNATNVYFYEEVSVSGETTYSLSASKQQVLVNESINVDSIAKSILRDDTAIEDTLNGRYSYEVKSGNNTVLKLENGALTGLEAGTATVRVTYTWGDNQEHEIWKEIPVTVKNPYFTVDIQENGKSISVLAVKNIKHGENEERTTKQLTAQVLSNNTTPMEGVTVVWTSSNEKIVTVDSTGKLTFTGTEGTANVFAVYKFAEGEEYTDRVTVTASRDAYITTADGTNDFPEYPNEGSIRFDKTAQAVGDFNKTGIAQVELSMTGVPYSKGVDVIVMLDMSSSMTRCIHCNKKSGESGGCSTFRSREQELADAMAELQAVLQASDNAANIRIAVADFNGTQGFGPTQYNVGNHEDSTADVGALDNLGNQKVYTGPNAGNAGTTVNNNNRRTLLSAQAFIPVSQLDVSKFNYAPSTGTNYDYGFDAVYQLGYAIKQKNIADNDPDRELFVIFMSDGASNQFNYYNTTGGRSGDPGTSNWDAWLTGNVGEGKDYTFSQIIACTTHSYYFDAATGNQHRMANAIKGNPNQKYEVIRKNQNLSQNQNQGGNDAVTEILEATGQDNLYKIPGLGATTYTIAFYVYNDGNISAESAKHSLRATASSQNHYIEAEEEGAIGAAFKNIAGQIVEAAKDVVVTDQMADEYTMIFEVPNQGAAESIPGQEFYIEILDYTLDQTTHERVGNGTSLMKLYMGVDVQKNDKGEDVIHYYAASKPNSKVESGERTNQYAEPVFEVKPLGSMYYWTTDKNELSADVGVSLEINGATYYFDPKGKKQVEGEAVPADWYNMTSGAFASGTVTEDEHRTPDNEEDDTSYANDLIIATPYFVYNANTKMLYWTLEKIGRNETVLRYFLYLDESGGYRGDEDVEAGSYPTNEGADLTYTNFQDNPVQQEFPKPQMTWHGAQATYVFYLVNSKGQPVNRAGRVVPFSEAVYVTESYTKSVVWSEDDHRDSFTADTLAAEIVPSVYTLYDEQAFYNIHVFANAHDSESNVNNHFQIGGDPSKVRSTYVFNTKADKYLYREYGTYTQEGVKNVSCTVSGGAHNGIKSDHNTQPGLDYYDTTVAFAVLWIPALSPEEIVVDYGLDVVVDVTQNDLAAAEPIGLLATPPLQDNGEPVEINKGQFEDPTVYESLNLSVGGKQIATATLEGNNIRITLDRTNGMHFTGDILFYYVSKVQFYDDRGTLQSEYMYTSFRVIPATTIYYEEDYVTFDEKWKADGGNPNPKATQDVDRPGPNRIGAGYDADNPYGYDSAYLNCDGFSLNTSKVATVTAISTTPPTTETDPTTPPEEETESTATMEDGTESTDQVHGQAEDTESDDGTDSTEDQTDPTEDPTEPAVPQVPGPTATFTFTGTGFDIIGRTDTETTSILVKVKQGDQYVVFGNDVTVNDGGTTSSTEINGDTIFVDTYFEGVGKVKVINQVPVVTVRDLNYGTYTVTVEVVINNDTGSPYAHGAEGKFYLDAVRIYDPAQIAVDAAGAIREAYKADGEWLPEREEIGNVLLKQYGSNKVFCNVMFVDRNGTNSDISIYETRGPNYEIWGPNNELYLASGQSLVLTVDSTFLPQQKVAGIIAGVADMQLGMKLANGSSATVTISSTTGKSKVVTLTSATDLNFSIMDYYSGTLTIKNDGDGILSLTNWKVTFAPEESNASYSLTDQLNEAPTKPEENVQTKEPVEEIPEASDTVIARGVLLVKETIAAVIIAVAEAMESISNLLENIANALFAGGG